jgi:hypothetical protein
LNPLREQAFADFPGLQAAWLSELEEAEATQSFLNATQNFPLLIGMKVNLYKCFLPVGWRITRASGICGFLHPEGPYEDTSGGTLREAAYKRLRAHFQFQNEKKLFPIGNRRKFGVNIYAESGGSISFDHCSNVFLPTTIDSSYLSDGHGRAPGIKTDGDEWELNGHRDRIIVVTQRELALFAQIYDKPATPPRQARLPSLHAGALLSVLKKFTEGGIFT